MLFILLICKNHLLILDTSHLSDIKFANIYSHSMGCLFISWALPHGSLSHEGFFHLGWSPFTWWVSVSWWSTPTWWGPTSRLSPLCPSSLHLYFSFRRNSLIPDFPCSTQPNNLFLSLSQPKANLISENLITSPLKLKSVPDLHLWFSALDNYLEELEMGTFYNK